MHRATEPLRPEGRPLYAGVRSLGVPDEPLAAMWRLGDQLREYRGDSHTMAWGAAGFDATEIGLLTELYWGLPIRSYFRTRAWTDADFEAATDRRGAVHSCRTRRARVGRGDDRRADATGPSMHSATTSWN